MRPMDLNTQRRKKKKKVTKRVKKLNNENEDPQAGHSSNSGQHTVDELVDLAEGYLDGFEIESAQNAIQRALELDADNPRALETAASLLIEGGDRDKAIQCLGRAITVAPLKGYSKYFSIAQLLEGRQALEAYQKGIQVLLSEREQQSTEEIASACGSKYNKELCSAYLSISELWMTDLCDENEAEDECQLSIHRAREADPTNPEPLQQLANFLIITQQLEAAKSAMEESVSLWLPQLRAANTGDSDDSIEPCPLSLPSRITAAKNLIELQQWDIATEILDLLLEENEELTEAWHLLGWLNYLRKDTKNAHFYLKKALEIAKQAEFENEDIIEHTEQLLNELGDDVENSEDEYEDIDSEASSSEDEQ